MYGAIEILTVVITYLIALGFSLVIARLLLAAVLTSMRHCALKNTKAVSAAILMQTAKPNDSTVEPQMDSHRR